MKTIILSLFCSILAFTQLHAQGIFDASIHTAIPFGDVDSPAAESAQQVIDQDSSTKFLDFNELDGIGFDVDLLGVSVAATSIQIVTANDGPERDPTDFEIFGSTDGTNFTSIATGTIPCIPDRFLSRTFQFTNTTEYNYYRVNFTGTCNPSTINQIADVQLYTATGVPPTLLCSDNIVIASTTGECGGIAAFDVLAEDEEDGVLEATQTLGPPNGSLFPLGETAVVFTVTDSDNNTTSCNFTITVEDSEAPTFECPSDMTVSINSGETSAVVNYNISVFDNCSVINPQEDYTSLGTIGSKSYYLSNDFYTGFDAFGFAESEDGFVGTIRNETDNQYLVEAIKLNTGGTVDVYIGYNDLITEGEFEWHNGDPSSYNNWNEGEPNNSGADGGPENFTLVQGDGSWNDVDGTILSRYLYEIDFVLMQTQGMASGSAFPLGTTVNLFEATDAAGHSTTCQFEITVDDQTSIVNQALENGITLSPNPTKNTISLHNNSGFSIENASIYDIHGNQVHSINMSQSHKQQTLDVSLLPSGIYLLKFKGEKGLATKRMIKL